MELSKELFDNIIDCANQRLELWQGAPSCSLKQQLQIAVNAARDDNEPPILRAEDCMWVAAEDAKETHPKPDASSILAIRNLFHDKPELKSKAVRAFGVERAEQILLENIIHYEFFRYATTGELTINRTIPEHIWNPFMNSCRLNEIHRSKEELREINYHFIEAAAFGLEKELQTQAKFVSRSDALKTDIELRIHELLDNKPSLAMNYRSQLEKEMNDTGSSLSVEELMWYHADPELSIAELGESKQKVAAAMFHLNPELVTAVGQLLDLLQAEDEYISAVAEHAIQTEDESAMCQKPSTSTPRACNDNGPLHIQRRNELLQHYKSIETIGPHQAEENVRRLDAVCKQAIEEILGKSPAIS